MHYDSEHVMEADIEMIEEIVEIFGATEDPTIMYLYYVTAITLFLYAVKTLFGFFARILNIKG